MVTSRTRPVASRKTEITKVAPAEVQPLQQIEVQERLRMDTLYSRMIHAGRICLLPAAILGYDLYLPENTNDIWRAIQVSVFVSGDITTTRLENEAALGFLSDPAVGDPRADMVRDLLTARTKKQEESRESKKVPEAQNNGRDNPNISENE